MTNILVTGASGTIGREVVRALRARGANVRVAQRDRTRPPPEGTTAVFLDWAQPRTFDEALTGIDRVFLLTPFIEDPQTPALAFIEAARRARVRFLLKLSADGVSDEAHFEASRQHARVEKALASSGVPFAILRPTFFMDNVLTFQREGLLGEGAFHGASGNQPVAYVSSRDVGEVAAAVLVAPEAHLGRTYKLTGGEAVTDEAMAAALTRQTGRSIRYVDHPLEHYRSAQLAQGAPGWAVEAMTALEGIKRQGWAAEVSPVVRTVLGRPPETAEEFFGRHARALRLSLTRELYDAFQRVELDRWDAIVSADVLINSPAGMGMTGLATLKTWAEAFAGGLAQRIDLVDEFLSLDARGDGRGFITFTLHWKHSQDFFGLRPTGREGTSVETLLLTVRGGRITRIDVADNSLDLPLYLWERGWNHPHNVRPEALVRGVSRG